MVVHSEKFGIFMLSTIFVWCFSAYSTSAKPFHTNIKLAQKETASTSNISDFNNHEQLQVAMPDHHSELAGDIVPPKHLDAVKVERDGNGNSDFHKEVFLGKEIVNFKNIETVQQRQILIDIFNLIDRDRNSRLHMIELSIWILDKTRDHFNEAQLDSQQKFKSLDADNDDLIQWDDYVTKYLAKDRSGDAHNSENRTKMISHDDVLVRNEVNADSEALNQMDKLKDGWKRASRTSNLSALTENEFLAFQHPEASQKMLHYFIHDILKDLDVDKDGKLTIKEWSLSFNSDLKYDNGDEKGEGDERETEFSDIIDRNRNGFLDEKELMEYLDPLSVPMAREEARQMVNYADGDNDGQLSLSEILDNSEYFTGSKLYNYGRNVHYDL